MFASYTVKREAETAARWFNRRYAQLAQFAVVARPFFGVPYAIHFRLHASNSGGWIKDSTTRENVRRKGK